MTLAAPAPVEGRLTDATGKPVTNAEVWVSNACTQRREGSRTYYGYVKGKQAHELFCTRTSTDGRFRFDNFPAGASADLAVRVPGMFLRPLEREHVGPDTMRCSSGQQDIELVVEPGGAIEGKVVAREIGQPLAGASFRLQPEGRPGESAETEPAASGPDGEFRLAGLAPGEYMLQTYFGTNKAPEWVAELVAVSVGARQTNREVTVTATRGGLLEVSVVGKAARAPAAEASLNVYKEHYDAGTTTDAGGVALMRLPPGEYHVSAYQRDALSEPTTIEVEAGKTNHLELVINPSPRITGMVRNSAGAPVSGIKVTLHGWGALDANMTESDAGGGFELPWSQGMRASRSDICLVARDAIHNLAAAQTLGEEITNIELRLQPGLTIAGSIRDPAGKPLTNATAALYMRLRNMGAEFDLEPPQTDARGRFQISGLPADRGYYLLVSARGYGSTNLTLEADSGTNRLEVEPVELPPANLKLAGQVLDADDKPAARAWVNTYGPGQPNNSRRTDGQGRFTFEVCEGRLQVSASMDRSSGSATALAGDTNVIVRLGQNQSAGRVVGTVARRASLKGRPLPELTGLSFAGDAVAAGKPLLLCLFDLEQRPSRRLAKQLADQHDALRQKGVVVLGLQAAVLTPDSLKELKDSAQLPFPVGNVGEKPAQTKWVSGVNSLPWLILTDATRTVIDEGFAIEDLEGKLKAIGK